LGIAKSNSAHILPTLETPVLIVGGGPVGLTLAVDLGRLGIPCILVERKSEPAFLPKMERCNARSLEIFRRMGIAERVRDAGYPLDYPMDVYHVTTLTDQPIAVMPYPSVLELKAQAAARNDGVMPLEPYQLISQYTLEPLLKRIAEENPLVDVRFGHELVSFDQDSAGMNARIRTEAGADVVVRAAYMVGCDGGTSTVRKQLEIPMQGRGANLRQLHQALFRCDRLYDVVKVGHGRHYYVADDQLSAIVCQDSCRHFSLHAEEATDAQMPEIFARSIGAPVDFEMIAVTRWSWNLLCADRYIDGRVFLAGDSAHLVVPTAGLGLNTGIGDAVDLSWKLAAVLRGWGGPRLLQSYEEERRQVGVRNVRVSGDASYSRFGWRSESYRPWIREDSERGREARANLARVAAHEAGTTTIISGIERGYRYTSSSVLRPEEGDGPDPDSYVYEPTSWPGARLPHMWLRNGDALLDKLGPWFTVLRFGERVDTTGIERALDLARVPHEVLALDQNEPAFDVYGGFGAFLVRPDAHVAWRADRTPADPQAIVATATGC
jgi:2-polyprenyl-6-methoxyphenol hydroxylase-like FAD-dependent oxidoreductase